MDSEGTCVRPGAAEQHQKQEHKARNKKKRQPKKMGVKKELEEVFLHCESPSSELAGKDMSVIETLQNQNDFDSSIGIISNATSVQFSYPSRQITSNS